MFRTNTSTSTRTRSLARYTGLLAVPLLVGVLAACSPTAPSERQTTATTEQTFADWQVSFAACMRDNGIDMPDPAADGSQSLSLGDSDPKALEAASETCREELGDPPAPAGQKETPDERFARQLEMAKCFRENGVDIADPTKGSAFQIPEASDEVLETCGLGAGAGGMTSVTPAG